MSQEELRLRRRYEEARKSGEAVFDGHPLVYFERMKAEELYGYKEANPEFENSWVFKAILQCAGPTFYRKAKYGHDCLEKPNRRKIR